MESDLFAITDSGDLDKLRGDIYCAGGSVALGGMDSLLKSGFSDEEAYCIALASYHIDKASPQDQVNTLISEVIRANTKGTRIQVDDEFIEDLFAQIESQSCSPSEVGGA